MACRRFSITTLVICFVGAVALGDDKGPFDDLSVNEIMIQTVTPATDAIWNAEPQGDDDWQALDEAAIKVVIAFESMKDGGTGESDAAWAAQPDWDAWADEVIAAANLTREAVLDRNIDLVYEAGDVLYPPCENCHLKYHPDFIGQ